MRSVVSAIRNASLPVPMVSRAQSILAGLTKQGPDDQKNMAKYGEIGTLFATVNLLATATSQVTWRLFQTQDSAGRGRISQPDPDREVHSHLALSLLQQPNAFMPWQLFSETFQQHLDLTGKAYWVIQRSPLMDAPLSMWPVRPDRMTPVPDPDNFLMGWVYEGPNGEAVPLETTDVIWLRYPHPTDPYDGLGPVQAIFTSLESSKFVDEYNRNFFKNDASPGGIVQLDRRLTEDEFDEVTERWTEQHQGVNRAHRVAFLEQGAQWVERKYTMNDMQFVQLRTMNRDIIYEAFGVSKGMLGVVDDVNRANIEGSEYIFAKYRLVSRLERIKGALNTQFLPMFGTTAQGLEFDYDNPIPADWQADAQTMRAQGEALLKIVEAGFDPSDAANAIGLPEMKYIGPPARLLLPPPQNQTGADPEDVPGVLPPSDAGNEDTNGASDALVSRIIAAVKPLLLDARPVEVHNHITGLYRGPRASTGNPVEPTGTPPAGTPSHIDPTTVDLSAVQDTWQSELDKLMASYAAVVVAQKADLVAQVDRLIKAGHIDQLADLKVDTEPAVEMLLDAMSRIYPTMAVHVVTDAERQGVKGVVTGDYDADALHAVAQVVAQLLGNELAVSAGRTALAAAGPDVSADVVTASVKDHLDGLSTANTEQQLGSAMTAAQNMARHDTFKATAAKSDGPVAALYAVEVMDKNTCENCALINGRWIGNTDDTGFSAEVEALYPTGGYIDCLGGTRCRGTITGVWRPATVKKGAV